jgi:3-hydroxyacyl-[acyl-carrier-protein] dehydratase
VNAFASLDRIVELGDREAVAVRNVPNTLTVFETHFPRFPVLPGVLLLASMAELASALLAGRTRRAWTLGGAEHVRYRHFVRPGDQVTITATVKSVAPREARVAVAATVDGTTVATARALVMEPA